MSPSPVAAQDRAPEIAATFAELGVPQHITDRLAERGIIDAFPIQVATLVDALAGRDLCGKAPTGSGKTIAFGIPMVSKVSKAQPKRPRGLILVPTRELATQVHDELVALGGRNGPSVQTFFGGVGFGNQLKALRRGVDIAVACPGRLADLVQQGEIYLDQVQMVVLDEADRMADMGFLPEVKRLLDRTPDNRQTLLFSATLDGDVTILVKRYQKDPVRHELAIDEDAPQNRHEFWQVERPERVNATAQIVAAEWPAVVFCRTRRGADRVAGQLNKLGVSSAAIHGDRSQGQRERALADFVAGRVQALVATDIAARGIHVDDVACVVHFDVPADHKDYVHRSGRTGRAGAAGLVVSLVPKDQTADIRKIQKALDMPQGVNAPALDVLGPIRPAPAPQPARREDQTQRNFQGGGARRSGPGGGGGGRRQGAPKAGAKPAARNGANPRSGSGGNAGGGQSRRRGRGAPGGSSNRSR